MKIAMQLAAYFAVFIVVATPVYAVAAAAFGLEPNTLPSFVAMLAASGVGALAGIKAAGI